MLCTKVCPILNKQNFNNDNIQKTYISWNKNKKQRKRSSSGGLFPAFSKYFIDNGGIVIGAGYDENMHLKHKWTDNQNGLKCFSGSKYLQSDTKGIYFQTKQFLDKGKLVFFSGVPCQILGLFSYLGNNYDNLFACEVFCHGVPSPEIFKDYISYLEKDGNKIIGFDFRSKILTWSKPCVKLSYKGRLPKYTLFSMCNFITWFGLHLSVRESCFNCPCRTLKRNADLSIGDFWGIEDVDASLKRRNGISALIINSKKGDFLFEQISENLFFKKCTLNQIIKKNKWLIANYDHPIEREKFFHTWKEQGITGLIKRYPSAKISSKLINRLKSFIQ